MSQLTHEHGLFQRYVEVAADRVIVVVRSPERAVVQDIANSISAVPAGFTVVPLCVGLSPETAALALGLSGLVGHTYQDPSGVSNLPMHVVTQAPNVGAVVRTETSVAIGVLPK